MSTKIFIIGAGGLGREISATLNHPELQNKYVLRGFIDDRFPPGEIINGTPVRGDIEWLKQQKDANVILAVENPKQRQEILDFLSDAPLTYPTIIHPGASLYEKNHIYIGKGCFIAQNTILTTNIRIGDHCFINTSCTIHCDTVIGNNCVLNPGVHLFGGVETGDGKHLTVNPKALSTISV